MQYISVRYHTVLVQYSVLKNCKVWCSSVQHNKIKNIGTSTSISCLSVVKYIWYAEESSYKTEKLPTLKGASVLDLRV